MITYLVTGGLGFIGSNFIRLILDKSNDIKIINVDNMTYAGNPQNLKEVQNDPRYQFEFIDICDEEKIDLLFRNNEIDVVVNFAAESHVDRSIENPNIFANTNVLGTLNLLNKAMKYWTLSDGITIDQNKKFLQVSTDEVYGSLGKEGYFSEITKLDPRSPYSSSKASADMFVKAYFETYKMPINITRCSNNYGPNQFPEKLIPLMINNCLQHKKLPIYGDGLNVRDWLYVTDHCEAIYEVIKHGKLGEVYNIGGNNEKTNIEMVKRIIKYINENIDGTVSEDLIEYVTDRRGHDRRYAIDSTKIQTELNWVPKVSFEKGIVKTIQWYLDNKNWISEINNNTYQNEFKQIYRES